MTYELRCRECGKSWGNRPRIYLRRLFLSPGSDSDLDYDAVRSTFTRDADLPGPANMWRYSALLPVPRDLYRPTVPTGFTPLLAAPRLARAIGRAAPLYQERRGLSVLPSFQGPGGGGGAGQRRRISGSTPSAAPRPATWPTPWRRGAARLGLRRYIPPGRCGARRRSSGPGLRRGWCGSPATTTMSTGCARRSLTSYNWGFVNVNLRPYYAEGSKTVGFEIAEQLGWRLPDNVVCHGGRIAHHQNQEGVRRACPARTGRRQAGEIFGAQATGCSPISTAVKAGDGSTSSRSDPTTIARSLAIGNPADGHYAIKASPRSGGWAEDVSDVELVDCHPGIGRVRRRLHRDRRRSAPPAPLALYNQGGSARRTTVRVYHRQRVEDHRCDGG